MRIKAYISGECAWSGGVCAILDKYGLPYEKIDVGANRDAFEEMRRKSGQSNTPCVEIDGILLADICGQEVEDYLISHQLIGQGAPEGSARIGDKSVAGARLVSQTQFF